MDDKIINLKAKYDEINDVATEQEKQQKITDLIDDVIDKSNPFQNLATEDRWIEDDIIDKNDSKKTIEISKNILKDINKKTTFKTLKKTKKTEENKIPADAGRFIRSEIEATDFKKIRASYKNNS